MELFLAPGSSWHCGTNQATLKKNVVSGPAAGCVYYCRMGILFFILPKKNISSFSYKKKKKEKKRERFGGRPTGHNFGHPLDRKQFFF